MNKLLSGSPFLDAEFAGPAVEQVMSEPKPRPPAPAPPPRIRVQDAQGQPLKQRAWTVVQGGVTLSGRLDDSGYSEPLGRANAPFDARKPFRLHLPGAVAWIVKGAVLDVADKAVEYGGSQLDWKLAEGKLDEQAAFWREYEAVRTDRDSAVAHDFRRHDHVVRRPVRLLGDLAVFEARAPQRVLGPLVRYTDARQALVWLEMATPALVRVVYGKAPRQDRRPAKTDVPAATASRHACTVRVGGRHFALVTLDGLAADTTYQYRVEFAPPPPSGALPWREADFTPAVFPPTVNPLRTLGHIAFDDADWFFLRTLPTQSTALQFAHGSCRKWPGDVGGADDRDPGPDALELFGQHALRDRPWAEWPRFFMHTGDQIYADDIGVGLGTTLVRQRRAATLPGPRPKAAGDVAFGAFAGRFGWRYATAEPAVDDAPRREVDRASDLRPALRASRGITPALERAAKAQRQQAAFDAALKGVAARPMGARHRVLNRLLWSVPVEERDVPRVSRDRGLLAGPTFRVPGPPVQDHLLAYPSAGETGGVHAADFAEYAALYVQAWSTAGAARVLAHLPSYMIFDDHEVTDDWNADPEWLKTIHSAKDKLAMWPMTVTDALAAYWVYQGWGNLSPQQAANDPRAQVLDSARRQGLDALPDLRRLIHDRAVRPTAPGRAGPVLDWHFAVPTGGTPFLVLDLRTDRQVLGKGGMSKARLAWLERELMATRSAAAFVVLPVPYLLPAPVTYVFRNPGKVATLARAPSTAAFRRSSDLEHPLDNEVWNDIKDLLKRLQARHRTLKTLAIVSGDVHFSCNLDAQIDGVKGAPRLLQLISSGLRQSITQTKQGQQDSAYRGLFWNLSHSAGVDRHRGMRITLGGLAGPGGKTGNFVYQPSLALVRMSTMPQGLAGKTVAVPRIDQTHLAATSASTGEEWRMSHVTQFDGTAWMSLHDPEGPPGRDPREYPKASGGFGLVKEAELGPEGEADFEALAGDGEHELVEIEAAEAPLDEATELVELEGEGFAAEAEDEADLHETFEAHEVIETEAAPVEAGEADDEALAEEEPA